MLYHPELRRSKYAARKGEERASSIELIGLGVRANGVYSKPKRITQKTECGTRKMFQLVLDKDFLPQL